MYVFDKVDSLEPEGTYTWGSRGDIQGHGAALTRGGSSG